MAEQRIASLDGLRALSILLVLLGHLDGTLGFPALHLSHVIGDGAHLGVQVFFVISGFLITVLLVEERDAQGSVSLANFYARRTVRILPAFLAYYAVLVWAHLAGRIHLSGTDFIVAATYTANYYPGRSWEIGHLWSLSVEEQFYLLWPLAVALISSRRVLTTMLACAFALAPLVRGAMHLAIHDPGLRDLEVFPAVADAISVGCLVALWRARLLQSNHYRGLTCSPWIWLAVPLILAANRFDGYTMVDVLATPLALALLAILIEACSRLERGVAWALLNNRPVVAVGVLSYSLYLWQQPFLDRHCHAWHCAFPANLALACGVACISYFALERPLLKLRHRLRLRRVPAQPGTGST